MSQSVRTKRQIITQICDHIREKLPAQTAEMVAEFAWQYLGSISPEDLEGKDENELYGIIISYWKFISERLPGELKLRIYNPDYEQDGWQSTHTIVEMITDDMPFLVDSLRMEINRQNLNTYLMIHYGGIKIRRDPLGHATEILPFASSIEQGVHAEAPIYIEIDRQTNPEVLENLANNLRRVLQDVRFAVEDWSKMRSKMHEVLQEIEPSAALFELKEFNETKDFLIWLDNNHFTFLGYRKYEMVEESDGLALKLVSNSGLGVLRDATRSRQIHRLVDLVPEARKQALSRHLLIISKTNTISSVHRPAYSDYIGIKCFDASGKLVGEHRFIGLYTSAAYTSNPRYIPFVREKVEKIMKDSNLSPTGHAAKALLNILETFPRDDLFQGAVEELTELAMGVLHLQERKRIRVFTRNDVFRRFISCLVYIPRERFDTALADAIQTYLKNAFSAIEISYSIWFSESVLARLHFVARTDPKKPLTYDLKEIENRLIEIARLWQDDLYTFLHDYYGEEKGNAAFYNYKDAFPAGYRETFTAATAVFDIEHMRSLEEERPLAMSFYRPLEESPGIMRFKLFRKDETIALSDSLPIFENMGMHVIGERPYEITTRNQTNYWINDFSMTYSYEMAFEVEAIKGLFQETFFRVWIGDAENDGFNRLVLGAGLSWREVMLIRAYAKYLKQLGLTYSQAYIELCFIKYPTLAFLLVQLFLARLDPKKMSSSEAISSIETKIANEMDFITVLDEDKIIRKMHEAIMATLRTNYFQVDAQGQPKKYFSIKVDPMLISEVPQPIPMYEIFVYSPRFEGVHLRSSKVARGGIRWSDRREDFRTEVLGLMKAQNVKNAVIVPSGAKGGFVTKLIPIDASRDEIMQEGIACYKDFIRGLLDLTDNYQQGNLIPPLNVVRQDNDDPYLVVAADKGTATFSDIANGIADEYQFWLGDAFASGGSSGYDHKKMAITARGAWESVKRHFRNLDIDVQNQDFTVVGIGDMSGDVFGNGMLLSKHIKLVAAFDHRHIFIDPNPDPEISFKERERLFQLSRSSWDDYNKQLISKGGGVFPRNVKSIKLSPEVKTLLDIQKDTIIPSELICCILKAKVDLLWNGGIGTFVKSSKESNLDVGDRTTDATRINGNELRCRVVGEGGNLGFTQLGRIEYDLNGGLIFTDFIDNSAGVDCSDHEVNVKILLNEVMTSGDMTLKQRDKLLVQMTEEVAGLVLDNNYHQTQSIELSAHLALRNVDLHIQYMRELTESGYLDPKLEFLPDEHVLHERKALGRGLTKPELAIIFAYTKNILKKNILDSDIPEGPHLSKAIEYAFPEPIRKKFLKQMNAHRLRREIIATIISSTLVNETGTTFIYQLTNQTGAPTAAIIRAYGIARAIFSIPQLRQEIEALDNHIHSKIQLEMLAVIARLARRSTRWFLRNRRSSFNFEDIQAYFANDIMTLSKHLPELLPGSSKEIYSLNYTRLIELGVPESVASFVAGERAMISTLDIIDAAKQHQCDIMQLADVYFSLGERMDLYWFREQLDNYVVENQWENFAREACRDDLDLLQRRLAISVLRHEQSELDITAKIDEWLKARDFLVKHWQKMLHSIKSNVTGFSIFSVAVRELSDLAQIES